MVVVRYSVNAFDLTRRIPLDNAAPPLNAHPRASENNASIRRQPRVSVNNTPQAFSSRAARYRPETTHEITRNIADHLVNTGNIYQTFLLPPERRGNLGWLWADFGPQQ